MPVVPDDDVLDDEVVLLDDVVLDDDDPLDEAPLDEALDDEVDDDDVSGPPTHAASVVALKKSSAARDKGRARSGAPSGAAVVVIISAPQNGQRASLTRT